MAEKIVCRLFFFAFFMPISSQLFGVYHIRKNYFSVEYFVTKLEKMRYYGITPNYAYRSAYLFRDSLEHKKFIYFLRDKKFNEAKLQEVTFVIAYRSPNHDAEYATKEDNYLDYYVWDTDDKEEPFLDLYNWSTYVHCWDGPMYTKTQGEMGMVKFLMSERMKTIFDKYIIAPHVFIPVYIRYREEKRRYYIFSLIVNPYKDELVFNKLVFDIISFKDKKKYGVVEGKDFADWSDLVIKTRPVRKELKKLEIRQYIYKEYADIFKFNQAVMVNEDVMSDLISHSIQPLAQKVKIEEPRYTDAKIVMPRKDENYS